MPTALTEQQRGAMRAIAQRLATVCENGTSLLGGQLTGELIKPVDGSIELVGARWDDQHARSSLLELCRERRPSGAGWSSHPEPRPSPGQKAANLRPWAVQAPERFIDVNHGAGRG